MQVYPVTSIGGLSRACKSTDGPFTVHIDSARGIAARDINGTSDPFVIVRLMNYDGSVDEAETFQTLVQPKTFPVWGYKKEWRAIKPKWKKIQFEDTFRTQFIGMYEHDIESVVHKDSAYEIYELKPRSDPKKRDVVTGTIKLAFVYNNDLLRIDEAAEKQKKLAEEQHQKELREGDMKREARRQLENEHKEKDKEELEKRIVDLSLVTDITTITDGLLLPEEAVKTFNKLVLTKDFMSTLTPARFQNKTDPVLTAVMKGFDNNICSKLQNANLFNEFISWVLSLERYPIVIFMTLFEKCDFAPLLNEERFSDSQDGLLTLLMNYMRVPICESLNKCDKMIKAFDWAQGATRKTLLRSIRWSLQGHGIVTFEKNPIYYDLVKYFIKEFCSEEKREAAFRVYMSGISGNTEEATLEDVAACGALSPDGNANIRGLLWANCITICIASKGNTDNLMQLAFDTVSTAAELFRAKGKQAFDNIELEQFRYYKTYEAISNARLMNSVTGMTNEKRSNILSMCSTDINSTLESIRANY